MNRPDLVILDKKKKEITIIEVEITSQNQLAIVENEKKRKYDILPKEIAAIHKYKTIFYILTWDDIVTKCNKSYVKQIGLPKPVEAYIQYITLKKTLESISYDYRREGDDGMLDGQEIFQASQSRMELTPEVKANGTLESSEKQKNLKIQ